MRHRSPLGSPKVGSRAPTDDDVARAAAAVYAWTEYDGRTWIDGPDLAYWIRERSGRRDEFAMSDSRVSVTDALKRAARRGWIGTKSRAYGRSKALFASLVKLDAEQAERDLTPAQRADRTYADALRRYDEGVAKSPEEPAWWQLADTAVNHRDGWAHAVETGLLVHVVVPATHRYLAHEGHVPYERLEAYQEAMALWLRTERALEARTDGARGRALALAGDGLLTNRKVTLTTDQLERLLALIPQEEGT